MANDEEYVQKILFEEINGDPNSPPDDPDARFAWELAHDKSPVQCSQESGVSPYDNEREGAFGISMDHQPSHYVDSDDAQLAMQLDEQLKLAQEQEDAEIAQRLLEEEEQRNRVSDPHYYGHRPFLHARRRGTRGRLPNSRGNLNFRNDVEEDGERNLVHGPTGHRTRPFNLFRPPGHIPRQGAFPHNLFSEVNIRDPHHHPHRLHPFLPVNEEGLLLGVLSGRLGLEAGVNLEDYEELWDLAERIGNVKVEGISQEKIDELPFHSYNKDASPGGATCNGHTPENKECRVCLMEFSEGDEVRTLPCLHMYHKPCIDKWLQRKGDCPICREKVIKNKKGDNSR